MTLFILSVLVMAGTDNIQPLDTSGDSYSYGYGYGYGYGDYIIKTGSGSRTNDYINTKILTVKFIPANDGFDYDSIPRPNKTNDTFIGNDTQMNQTWFNDTFEKKPIEKEQKKPFPITETIGGLLLLGLFFIAYMKNKQRRL